MADPYFLDGGKGGQMNYRFTITPIVISAPTEEDAWDELFHQYDIDPNNVEISVECIGENE